MPTTTPTFRPLNLGQILDHAIRYYRRNFFKFIGIIALVQIPITLIELLISAVSFTNILGPLSDPSLMVPGEFITMSYFLGQMGNFITRLISFVVIQVIATAALTRTLADNRLGLDTGILGAYRKVGQGWFHLLGTLLVLALIGIGLMIWWLVPIVGWVTGPGMLLFLGMVLFPLMAPVVIIEKKSLMEAIRRAWDLSRRRFWWMIGFALILNLFSQIVVTGPSMLVTFGILAIAGDAADYTATLIIGAIVQSLTQLVLVLIYVPLQVSAITLVYFDLRVRTEGFDLALQANALSNAPSDISQITTQAPSAGSKDIITTREFGYFAILSIGIGVLYMAIVGLLVVSMLLLFSATELGGF